MNRIPIAALISATDTARVMQKDKNIVELLHLTQRLTQPAELRFAHLHIFWALEFLRARPLIGIEHEKAAALVLEPIPERTEVLFIVILVFLRRLFGSTS